MKRMLGIVGLGAIIVGGAGTPAIGDRAHAATGAAPVARCHTGRLAIAPVPGSGQGGVGHLGMEFKVRSLAQQPCSLYGYPGAQLIDGNGRDLSTKVQWGNGYLFGNSAKRMVTLATGASAYFGLEWVHIPSPGQACPTAGYLLVTPPDERTTIVVPVGLSEVCGGRLTATPMLASPIQ